MDEVKSWRKDENRVWEWGGGYILREEGGRVQEIKAVEKEGRGGGGRSRKDGTTTAQTES